MKQNLMDTYLSDLKKAIGKCFINYYTGDETIIYFKSLKEDSLGYYLDYELIVLDQEKIELRDETVFETSNMSYKTYYSERVNEYNVEEFYKYTVNTSNKHTVNEVSLTKFNQMKNLVISQVDKIRTFDWS